MPNRPAEPTCEQWLGYKPCPHQQQTGLANCSSCLEFQPAEPLMRLDQQSFIPANLFHGRIAIVEMGGLGSILRTTAVSRALRQAVPNRRIDWYTHSAGAELLLYVPGVNPIDVENLPVPTERIQETDVVLNFEFNDTAKEIVRSARSVGGFALNEQGKLGPATADAEYLQRMQIDDEFRRTQTRSMQRVLLSTVGLDDKKAGYDLRIPPRANERAHAMLTSYFGPHRPVVGLNLGTSQRGRLKRWPAGQWAALAARLATEGQRVMVLSGPEDDDIRAEFLQLHRPNDRVVVPEQQMVGDFMATVGQLDALVTGDTFAHHVAQALATPTITLAGPMPAKEIETSVSDALIGPRLDCSPCYYRCRRDVLGECMHLIDVDSVAASITTRPKPAEDRSLEMAARRSRMRRLQARRRS